MDVEDFLEPEIAVAATVTAAVTSPQVRKALRTGAVYGLAGLLAAGDAITTFSRSVGRGVQQASTTAANGAQQATSEAKAATSRASRRTSRGTRAEAGHESGEASHA
jgi:hypothetical protein